MRLDKKIAFVSETGEVFDPSTGDYTSGETVKDYVWANVSDTGERRMQLLYGALKLGAKTIRLNSKYKKLFDYIEIDGKNYSVTLSKEGQQKSVYEVSER
ncbi:MAG: hypothetical protein L0L07_00060 [Staphylococcus equorum]|nr:hypothetical protein [Staphylococcus equorum]